MATLAELRAAVFPGVRDVGAKTPKQPRDVAWVRVLKARVPAFDALEPGDVAIVPASALSVVAPTPSEIDALVAACTAAPVAALVLVDGADSEDAQPAEHQQLAALAGAARRAGLVAWRADRGDAPAIERSVIGYLVNRHAELEHQAALLESELESLALKGADLDALVAATAEFLGRAVVVEGPRGAVIASHAPVGTPGVAAIAAYHRDNRRVALRSPLPGADAGIEGASLVLPGDVTTELERTAVERIGGFVALELARDEALRRAQDSASRAEPLPAAGPPWVVLVARQRPSSDADSRQTREQARRELRLVAPARRMSLRGDADSLELRAILAVDATDADGTGMARRVATSLRRPVAISRPFGDAGQRPAAEADARATLEAIEGLAEPPAVGRADRLAAYRLLGNLRNLPDGRRLARALLQPLLESRPDIRREHLATLRAVLDQPGLAEAATALDVHRNTIAYRVRRIEQLTGWRLTDPELRLPLALAVRLVQEDQI